jgi:hypothetical protein
MSLNKLGVIPLIIAFTIGCSSLGWAEEAPPPQQEASGGAVAGAVVSNVIYIPGKAGICVISAGVWTATMILTFGTIYKDAGRLVYDTCSGKWVIKPEDMIMEGT